MHFQQQNYSLHGILASWWNVCSWKTSASTTLWFLNLLDQTHTWVGPKAKASTNKCLLSVRQKGDDVSPHPVGFASPTLICSLLHTTRIITQIIAAHSSGTSACCWKFVPPPEEQCDHTKTLTPSAAVVVWRGRVWGGGVFVACKTSKQLKMVVVWKCTEKICFSGF